MTATLDILARLVAFDTTSARSNLGLIAYAEEHLRGRGFAVRRVEAPCGRKAGLFAALGPRGRPGIMLSGHTDTVPAGQGWTRDPFAMTVEDGRAYGRGTTDMKGFVAAALALADRAAGRALAEPLKIALSYDEEVGCVGIGQMIDRLEPAIGAPRLCIVGEPTGMRVATGHKGKASYGATCHGRGGHSALAPRLTNALHVAADLMAGLRALQRDLTRTGARDPAHDVPHSTVHVGRLAGGDALNMVPDTAEMLFEVRLVPGEDGAAVEARIEAAAWDAAARSGPGARVALERIAGYPGLDLPEGAGAAREACRLAGTAGTIKVAFGTEAGVLAAAGVPSVVCGPGSMAGQGHRPDEYVETSQLAACDAMMDRVLDALAEPAG